LVTQISLPATPKKPSDGFVPDWNAELCITRNIMWISTSGIAGKTASWKSMILIYQSITALLFSSRSLSLPLNMKQMIWEEVGEDQFEREKVLLDLEQECLEVYRRKVDNANISRARLHQELAESEAEFTHLLLSLGERSLPGRVYFSSICIQITNLSIKNCMVRN